MKLQLIAIALVSAPSLAQSTVILENPGFEALSLPDGASSNEVPGWGFDGSYGTLDPDSSAYQGEAPEGQNVAWVGQGSIAQLTGEVLCFGQEYELRVRVGQREDLPMGTYYVMLSTYTEVLVEVTAPTPQPGQWQEIVVSYTADNWSVGGPLIVVLGGHGGHVNFDDVRLTRSLSTNYCTALPNSTGLASSISQTGVFDVQWNDFDLHASNLPGLQPGLFFFGAHQTDAPFGLGRLCVTGAIHRLEVVQSSASGGVSYDLDFTSPTGSLITNGSTWNFQYWYRDPFAGGAAFNLSDGLEVTFCEATGF